jgi:hypothetical protein
MKKQLQVNNSSQPLRSIVVIPNSQPLLTNGIEKQKVVQQPDEATIKRLNSLAKQSPFCYYYREKENDSL